MALTELVKVKLEALLNTTRTYSLISVTSVRKVENIRIKTLQNSLCLIYKIKMFPILGTYSITCKSKNILVDVFSVKITDYNGLAGTSPQWVSVPHVSSFDIVRPSHPLCAGT